MINGKCLKILCIMNLELEKKKLEVGFEKLLMKKQKKLVGQSFSAFSVDQVINKYVIDKQFFGNDRIKDEIQKLVASELVKQITLSLKTTN